MMFFDSVHTLNMSRYRNRNNKSKFFVPSATQKRRDEDRTADSGIDLKRGYGDQVKTRSSGVYSGHLRRRGTISSSSSGSDIDIIEEDGDVRKDSLGKSSTSSLSWAEDYEMQATEMVKEEYERMERVLQCMEPIPQHYDKDEYRLWIKTFPYMSLTSQVTNRLSPNPQKAASVSPEVEKTENPSEPSKKTCDKTTSTVSRNSANLRNLAVIDKLLGELYPAQRHQTTNTSSTTYSNNRELAINSTINPRTLDVAFGSFLQIAPVTLPKKTTTSGNSRRNSTSKSRWHQISPRDFVKPLPDVSYDQETPRQRVPRGNYSTQISQTNSDFIVLPPIEGFPNFSSRSVSAQSTSWNQQRKGNSETMARQPQIFESNEMETQAFREPPKVPQKRRSRFVKLLRD